MKIRSGWVSNSSTGNFMIPSFLLTDEQKEVLLFIDEDRDTKKKAKEVLGISLGGESENNYPRKEEYHSILEQMEDWDGWEVGEYKDDQIIRGSTLMDNGCLREFMQRIGIDVTAAEFTNSGHNSVHMATHPSAVAHFSKLYHEAVEEWNRMSDEIKQFDREHGLSPMDVCVYDLDRSKFKPWGGDHNDDYMEYSPEEDGEGYSYWFTKEEAEKHAKPE